MLFSLLQFPLYETFFFKGVMLNEKHILRNKIGFVFIIFSYFHCIRGNGSYFSFVTFTITILDVVLQSTAIKAFEHILNRTGLFSHLESSTSTTTSSITNYEFHFHNCFRGILPGYLEDVSPLI